MEQKQFKKQFVGWATEKVSKINDTYYELKIDFTKLPSNRDKIYLSIGKLKQLSPEGYTHSVYVSFKWDKYKTLSITLSDMQNLNTTKSGIYTLIVYPTKEADNVKYDYSVWQKVRLDKNFVGVGFNPQTATTDKE